MEVGFKNFNSNFIYHFIWPKLELEKFLTLTIEVFPKFGPKMNIEIIWPLLLQKLLRSDGNFCFIYLTFIMDIEKEKLIFIFKWRVFFWIFILKNIMIWSFLTFRCIIPIKPLYSALLSALPPKSHPSWTYVLLEIYSLIISEKMSEFMIIDSYLILKRWSRTWAYFFWNIPTNLVFSASQS